MLGTGDTSYTRLKSNDFCVIRLVLGMYSKEVGVWLGAEPVLGTGSATVLQIDVNPFGFASSSP